ncbi:hypothetical protein [Burkholderia stagnalis]|uniref:hypothetical protein n=1 Tax=Burkholderia stagnalis TaxID=1503054 RepID=UPI000F5BEB7C|nr:hypothetical protein [Burkholderia stagnalis]RQQ01101.1 hypothetical protein DF164_28635 [Burkholderia stagnalis]RQY49580.1 hypothetical protein DF112_23070 [Burkholderia stagnalis]RQY68680.1 hypothetical protein DF110_19225 [Burkholderia stagnalis]TCW78734.1 hypothetical protein C5O80_31025 [Burkholderia sp. SRS-46]
MISRSTLDQLTDILRSELDKKVSSKTGSGSGAAATAASRNDGPRPLNETLRLHIDKLVASGVTDESQLARAAIEHVLRRQFGDALVNDPSFQSITSRVVQAILEHNGLRAELISTIASRK